MSDLIQINNGLLSIGGNLIEIVGSEPGTVHLLSDMGTTEYRGSTTVLFTGMPASVSDRYILYHWNGSLSFVSDFYLYDSNASDVYYVWRMRSYVFRGSSGPGDLIQNGFVATSRSGDTPLAPPVTGWTSSEEHSSEIGLASRDNWYYMYWTGWPYSEDSDSFADIRIIIDQVEGKGHTYIKNEYLGYASLNWTAVFDRLRLLNELRNPVASDIFVASSNDMSQLISYTPERS